MHHIKTFFRAKGYGFTEENIFLHIRSLVLPWGLGSLAENPEIKAGDTVQLGEIRDTERGKVALSWSWDKLLDYPIYWYTVYEVIDGDMVPMLSTGNIESARQAGGQIFRSEVTYDSAGDIWYKKETFEPWK